MRLRSRYRAIRLYIGRDEESHKSEKYNEHVGQEVIVAEDIPATGNGRVNYRGAEWYARSATGETIESGTKAIVRGMDGIILIVSPSEG